MKRAVFAAWRLAAGLARPSTTANLRRLHDRGESADGLTIRDATAADTAALARLHVTTWNATYAPFFIKGPGYALRERQWRAAFEAPPPGWCCLVVERADGELVGFAQAQISDHPEFRGELRKIYLLRDYQRLGLGRRLIGRVARRFRSQGINSMWLFGDARNPSSRAWTALGAVQTDDDPGNGNYGWPDLGALADIPDQGGGEAMDIRTALKDLAGTWRGSNQLWLSPDEPVRQSEGAADVHLGAREAFSIIRYTWADQGQPQDGMLVVRRAADQSALDGVWIDSWHVGKRFMTLHGESDRDGGLSLLGSYAAPTGPDWGWRIVISSGGPDDLLLRMFNISPDGEVYPAVEARYTREQTKP